MFRTGQFTPQLKLLYHTERIQDWLYGNNIYPILVEFDLSNACNHKCDFCTFKYIKDNSVLDYHVVCRTLQDLVAGGVKAINWTGGGEPLIHKYFEAICRTAKAYSLKQGLFTNGSLLNGDLMKAILDTHEWCRISLDAGSRKLYKKLHNVDDFESVVYKTTRLVNLKKLLRSKCDIGVGFVITPDNYHDIPNFVRLIDKVGADYGQLKPCINNYQTNWQYESEWWQQRVLPIIEAVSKDNPKVVVNDYKFKELLNNKERTYDKCYGHNFCPCIGATGDVWLCTHYRDIQGYSLGNIKKKSFKNIWESKKRQQIIKKIDFSKCQFCCKNHEINKALYAVKHPEARKHGDFL